MERLDTECRSIDPLDWQDDVDHTQWLEMFRPFVAVHSLHILSLDEFIAPTLQGGGESWKCYTAPRGLFVMDPDPSGSVRQVIE